MKFECPFGIGEIVTHSTYKNGELIREELFEIVAIQFAKDNDGNIEFVCLCQHPITGDIRAFPAFKLEGDSSFDQEVGRYPLQPDDELD